LPVTNYISCHHGFDFLATCDQDTRETVLNTKPYIEYSIIYKLPEVPRLCEALNAEKQYVDIGDCRLYCEMKATAHRWY
jgi:hypothetical protein